MDVVEHPEWEQQPCRRSGVCCPGGVRGPGGASGPGGVRGPGVSVSLQALAVARLFHFAVLLGTWPRILWFRFGFP